VTSRLFFGIIIIVVGVAAVLGTDAMFPEEGGMSTYWRAVAIVLCLYGVFTVGRFLYWKSMEAGSRGRKVIAGTDEIATPYRPHIPTGRDDLKIDPPPRT
jgi:hypothetical protein